MRLGAAAVCLSLAMASVATVGDAETPYARHNLYGMPGLIDMPNARVFEDAQFSSSIGGFSNQQRGTFAFQITPSLTGAFRYARFADYTGPGSANTFDRSFDLHYQLWDEGDYTPAVAVGLRDFLGTGVYSGEYVVATKSVTPAVSATVGLGWGRFGSYNGFDNPLGAIDDSFNIRPGNSSGLGGTPRADQFFRGDAAFFGGLEWQVNDRLQLVAEYSSDAYEREVRRGVVEHSSPFNFGARYQVRPGIDLAGYYILGSELGLSATFALNPNNRGAPSGVEPAPFPVNVRTERPSNWDRAVFSEERVLTLVRETLAAEGIGVQAVTFDDQVIRLRIVNDRYRAEAQAIGRTARVLTQTLPDSVERFEIETSRVGVPTAMVTIMRSDMEELENSPDASWTSFTRARIEEADLVNQPFVLPSTEPRFQWGVGPYTSFTFFDGDQPLRADLGIQASIRYEIQPNLVLAGSARQLIVGDRADFVLASASALPPVRTNAALYAANEGITLNDLTLTWFGRPGDELYSRVTVGYMERMFGGVSTELLWKPVDSRLALGAELNYVAQRDFDLGFGFQDYTVLTGHVSAYYDFENGFHGRVDVGRYLAGDWGATIALNREFANGWEVGAYATLTDVPFEDFGEGSFDKGILLTIPIDWVLGNATRQSRGLNLSSLTRDGGARLAVNDRLYGHVRETHEPMLQESWGRFWR